MGKIVADQLVETIAQAGIKRIYAVTGDSLNHVNDAVRKAFPVKKVTSSRSKKETVVITEMELDQETLRAAISATGYDVGEIRKESWHKKGLFGR